MKEIFVKTKDPDAERECRLWNIEVLKNPEPIVLVESTKDEDRAILLAKSKKRIFVKCTDWKVIPLENLITKTRGKTKLIAVVSSAAEAKLALEIMEIGADGILLETGSAGEIGKLRSIIAGTVSAKIPLEEATVTSIKQLGPGARACIDTCTIMGEGQGMLVGSSSAGMLLVQAEVASNKLVNTRPFRVNAGAVSLYILGPKNRTSYLEEVHAGDEVLIIGRDGRCATANIARNKIEIRPLLFVEAKSKDGKSAKAVLQNAETIRLVTANGSIPVTELKEGSKVLARFEDGGRHFGMRLEEETIVEK